MNSTYLKKLVVLGGFLTLTTMPLLAFQPAETQRYFNGPSVTSVTSSGAYVSLSKEVLQDISEEEKAALYFEYFETHKMCIAIFPTPEACLPKKTKLGETNVLIKDLKPDTSYTIVYKRDNSIRCITTPCPENGFTSLSKEFSTTKTATVPFGLLKNLAFKSTGNDVFALQSFLYDLGYLKTAPTGYFGGQTLRAVILYQKSKSISPTGFVGKMTRSAIASDVAMKNISEDRFEGVIESFSTACFADAECSVTIDGKKVTVTIGRKQGDVGSLRGVESIADVEKKIGGRAAVYAKKTEDGYTLYGNSKYYIDIK
jgi:hypothetical protein